MYHEVSQRVFTQAKRPIARVSIRLLLMLGVMFAADSQALRAQYYPDPGPGNGGGGGCAPIRYGCEGRCAGGHVSGATASRAYTDYHCGGWTERRYSGCCSNA